jgi:hypothetical protein
VDQLIRRGREKGGCTEEGGGIAFEERMRSQTCNSDQDQRKGQLHGLYDSSKENEEVVSDEVSYTRYGRSEVPMPGRHAPLTGFILHDVEIENDALWPEPSAEKRGGREMKEN